MNLTNELTKVQNGEADNLLTQLYQEQQDICKKIYIVIILQVVEQIDNMLKEKIYDKFGSSMIQIHYDYEEGIGNIINFDLLDKYGVKIPIYTKNLPREIPDIPQKTKSLLYSLNGFSEDFVTEDFKGGDKIVFDVEPGLGSKVLDLLLSQELKKALEYNQMQLSLGDCTRANSKKPKV
jgi:phage-related holin